MATRCAYCLTLFCPLLVAANVDATPANRKALADFMGPLMPVRGFDCRTCHIAAKPTDEDHDHNPFGERLASIRRTLRAAGKANDLRSRLELIAEEDADGDGAANLVELLTGHSPGDAADRPGETELKDIDSKRAAFRKHLSAYRWTPFESVRRPPVPAVHEGNPVDSFLEAERRERDLTARPAAEKHVLLRRIYLDLIGLPPSRADQEAFLADAAPDAYERVVDRLLASPQYGARWGRHWMDIWRYSDWAGFGSEIRESVPHIWQWRDWIIESLNADKGYDQMLREMLAGDEIAPADTATLRATGFLARNSYKFNRNVWLDNTVEHTGKAFLGLTLNCARCHDHMYDPISQSEYYSFRAFFEPHQVRTDRVPGHVDTKTSGLSRVYDARLDEPTHLFVRGNEATPDKSQVCPPKTPAALGGSQPTIEPVPLPRDAYLPDRRPFVIEDTRTAVRARISAAQDAVHNARLQAVSATGMMLGPQWDVTFPNAAVVRASAKKLEIARLTAELRQAEFAALETTLAAEAHEHGGTLQSPDGQRAAEVAVIAKRQEVLLQARRDLAAAELAVETAIARNRPAASAKIAPARQAVATAEAAASEPLHANFVRRIPVAYPTTSSGRRLALARWITDRQNPLAARVAVNHIWARHFGQPLAPSVFDFGRNGQPPSHPALLDWLAAEFMDHGWSMKHLHRILVMSRAYRQDSRFDAACAERDPVNQYYWRVVPRRMEAEVVRDSVLALSGQLDVALGGPELDQGQAMTSFRRSVFYRHANEKQAPFLVIFDAASVNECYRRPASIAPQQALALANSPLTQNASRKLAQDLDKEVGPTADEAFVDIAFRRILNRTPSADEQRECLSYLLSLAKSAADAGLKARSSLVHVLFNHHDFVTIR